MPAFDEDGLWPKSKQAFRLPSHFVFVLSNLRLEQRSGLMEIGCDKSGQRDELSRESFLSVLFKQPAAARRDHHRVHNDGDAVRPSLKAARSGAYPLLAA